MGFISNVQNDDYRVASMGSMNPITELTPDGMFSGTGEALYKGVAGGLAAVGRTATDLFAASARANAEISIAENPFVDQQQALTALHSEPVTPPPFDESLKAVQDWAKADPRVQGTGAQVLGSTAHGLTVFGLGSLAGGPMVGAATLGGVEGYSDYRESLAAGVDQKTALEKAGLTGATAAAGAFLPMVISKGAATGLLGLAMKAEVAGNDALATGLYGASKAAATASTSVVAKMATGAAVNTGFGVANRYLTSSLLESAGYHDMAQQNAPLDSQAMIADAVLGLAFGGWEHVAHKVGEYVKPASRPDPALVQQSLDARRNEMQSRAGAGIPTDPHTAGLDAELQDRALGDMIRGKTTEVTPDEANTIVHGSLADPERTTLNIAFNEAGVQVHGDLADFSEPVRVEKAPEPFVAPEQQAPGAAPAAEGVAKLSPLAAESASQLAARHPDMEVQLPNGQTVRAADLQSAIQEQIAAATSESKLHDVAAACFLRTL
ncbi:hypothetical protein UFOVP147_42 [uncultured Caudovirales phage]|uniref:Uncharacterized protein n=1 Tax=uncultured Caudovirales phage TaxID=2100421 RepID=A0A6J7W5V5_9CAUD|nr:hypothetical protein UFOVP147_42 [uncultured Caudovirales phage]